MLDIAPVSSFTTASKVECMVSDANLLKLVEQIYDAAANKDSWEEFLSTLSEICYCTMAVLFWRDAARKQYDYTASLGIPPEYFRLYTEHFGSVMNGSEVALGCSELVGRALAKCCAPINHC